MEFAHITLLYFLLLIIGGHILLPIVLATFALSRKVHRNPTFLSWMITWIIYSISMCLTLYSYQNLALQPPWSLCIVQASLNYASTVLCSLGALMFVVNVWLSIQSIALEETPSRADRTSWRYFSIIFPYAAFVVVVLFISIVGSFNPSSVLREDTSFFCVLDLSVVYGVQGIAAITILAILYFEGCIVMLLHRMHKKNVYLRKSGGPLPTYHLCVRIAIFTTYIVFFIATCILIWAKNSDSPYYTFSYFSLSTVPLAVFAMFGTQRDLLSAYASGLVLFWNFLARKQDTSISTSKAAQGGQYEAGYVEKPLPPLPDMG